MPKKKMLLIVALLIQLFAAAQQNTVVINSGNPLFPGWYADPEVAIFNSQYWIYPTTSSVYDKQVYFDCFSSADLITWKKHQRILDTAAIKWAKRAIWAPAIVEKNRK